MSARTSFQSSASAINPPPSSTAVVPTLNALSDPVVCQIDGPTMDYLLIEVVNALRASSVVAANRARKIEHEMIEAGLIPAPVPVLPVSKDAPRDSVRSNVSRGFKAAGEDDEEAVQVRLEAIGMHVGANLTERLCHDRPLFSDTLDAVKFICKDLWAACWDKQVDNLRTNHRGIYVLQDNAFKPISRISGWEGREDAQKKAKLVRMTTLPDLQFPYIAARILVCRHARRYHTRRTVQVRFPECRSAGSNSITTMHISAQASENSMRGQRRSLEVQTDWTLHKHVIIAEKNR